MSALLYLAGAAGVVGITTFADISSSTIAESWAVDTREFLCKAGTGAADPSFRLAAENFPVVVTTSLVIALITSKYARHAFIKILVYTAVIYALALAIIGYMRCTTVPQFQNICFQLSVRTENSITTEAKDLITPFLTPLQLLPQKMFASDSPLGNTYAIIYPHLGEFLLTIEPYLLYFFVLFGIYLEIRPLRANVWHHMPVLGAVISFAVMAISEQSDFINAEPKDPLLNNILQYVIFYAATFIALAFYVVIFRLGMRRVSVVGLLFIISRLHALGLPEFEFHLEMLLVVMLITILLVTCEFSPGTFVLFAIAAKYGNWSSLEWGLAAMLLDNAVAGIVGSFIGGEKKQKEREKRKQE